MGTNPQGVAITPDGKRAYVTNASSNNVSVIDTTTNTVVATVPVRSFPTGVATFPPVPFSTFSAKLEIFDHDAFRLRSEFTVGNASNGINPPAEPVTLQVGTFATTIPPGSFKGKGFGPFHFHGVIAGVDLEVLIVPTGAKRYALDAKAHHVNLTGTESLVTVRLAVGDDTGLTSVGGDKATVGANRRN